MKIPQPHRDRTRIFFRFWSLVGICVLVLTNFLRLDLVVAKAASLRSFQQSSGIPTEGGGVANLTIYLPIVQGGVRIDRPLPKRISATVETDPVPSERDAADDPAIWIHPTDPALSLIIGTDKKAGVGVYDLTGKQLQFLPVGRMNNIDLRYNFPASSGTMAIVTTDDRRSNVIAVYQVNPNTRTLENVAGQAIVPTLKVYGLCMYHSAKTGKYYVFVNSESGEVEQWELFNNGSDKVEGSLARRFKLDSQTEGCVADDELGLLYISEEEVGIWKFGAEPDDGTDRVLVDKTGTEGHLKADVEGLTIYYANDGGGYLIASSQGSDQFVIYQREGGNEYIMTFEILPGNGIDVVAGTDGIDVSNFSLGQNFPLGVFVAHDGSNDDGNQNYKLVPWELIAYAAQPPLRIDTLWDPRQIGASAVP